MSAEPTFPQGRLVLLRHGETEWSRSGQHTGTTDVPLTPVGEEAARQTAALLTAYDVVSVYCSPMTRARRTAELAGLRDVRIDDDLREWDYGAYEGLTTPQVREQLGYQWEIFRYGVAPGKTPGETVEDVAARASHVLNRVWPDLHRGDVVLVAHGHLLRILTTVWLREQPRFGAKISLDAGSVSVLGEHHGVPTIDVWNRVT
ncbi:histidine phosphatase family protein [Luteipulveratus sp. YIM 133132]|uniref:Histidine phosphatase family protein n=1 Tax=Luteipulveratus flavus TaxID=3031728 RepID=A0ABT6CDY3_9MICO|nr:MULTISPECIES: histidine phosphatase family protein [unclassified Luteipulveratus]MDE9367375.1 histidine phosphatase family protein [Luteipulveratus sp. YIM 133132]MDF8266244.1 histidine phosphatase family protein [Luteipulveratus sp. YIM 133296]